MTTDGSDEMRKLAGDIALIPAAVRQQARAAMSKAGADIQAVAQNLAPVDTGALKNSISRDESIVSDVMRVEIGPTVKYAPFVENGTSRARAQPFLRPAVERVEPQLLEAFKQIGGRVL